MKIKFYIVMTLHFPSEGYSKITYHKETLTIFKEEAFTAADCFGKDAVVLEMDVGQTYNIDQRNSHWKNAHDD
jgi:hypothetical protein